MNELNYASLEASKKLYEAGIVLETEYFWAWDNDKRYVSCVPRLMNKGGADSHNNVVPAPCFTEVWRELPDIYQGKLIYLTKVGNQTQVGYGWPYMPSSSIVGQNINPTDAAIELKVWLKGAGK